MLISNNKTHTCIACVWQAMVPINIPSKYSSKIFSSNKNGIEIHQLMQRLKQIFVLLI